MIPVLGVPTLTRYDLLERMLGSIDEPVGRVVIVDNGGSCPEIPGVVHLPYNLGVAAAWNLIIKATPKAPWWALVNDDLTFAPGDLAHLAHAMRDPYPLLATLDGFSAFGVNRAAVERVGFFDENFHPAYVEDCDYEYRCKLAAVPIIVVSASLSHARSSTITGPLATHNGRTHPRNTDYYCHKWGGAPRGGEVFRTPFDQGGDVGDWRLSVGRLGEQSWHEETETTALWPVGFETR